MEVLEARVEFPSPPQRRRRRREDRHVDANGEPTRLGGPISVRGRGRRRFVEDLFFYWEGWLNYSWKDVVVSGNDGDGGVGGSGDRGMDGLE